MGPGSPQERGFPCSTRHLLCFLPAYYPDLCLSVCFSSLDKFSKNRAVFCLCLGFSAAKKQTVVVQFVLLCGPVPTCARDMGPVDKGLCSLKPRAKLTFYQKQRLGPLFPSTTYSLEAEGMKTLWMQTSRVNTKPSGDWQVCPPIGNNLVRKSGTPGATGLGPHWVCSDSHWTHSPSSHRRQCNCICSRHPAQCWQ